jgi:hypothetical protein
MESTSCCSKKKKKPFAEKMIDALIILIHGQPDTMNKLSIGQSPICRVNHWIQTLVTYDGYTAFLEAQIPTTVIANPAENVWKRRQTTVPDQSSDDFPELEQRKKTRTDITMIASGSTHKLTDPTDYPIVDIDEEMNKISDENVKLTADMRNDLFATMKLELASMQTFMKLEINKQIGELDMGTLQDSKANTAASIDERSRKTAARNNNFLLGIQAQIDQITNHRPTPTRTPPRVQ